MKHYGGINLSQLQDLTGETSLRNVGVAPGVFTHSGAEMDELASRLAEEGYAIDTRSVDGGAQQLRDLLGRALSGEKIYTMQGYEAAQQAEDNAAYRSAILEEAKRLGVRITGAKGGMRRFSQIELGVLNLRQKVESKSLSVELDSVDEKERAAYDATLAEARFMLDNVDAILDQVVDDLGSDYTAKKFIVNATQKLREALDAIQPRNQSQDGQTDAGTARTGNEPGSQDVGSRGNQPPNPATENETREEIGQTPLLQTPADAGVSASGFPEPVQASDGIAENPVDAAAHDAAASPRNDKPEPTDAQKQAGNYAKGHVRIAGLDISIENPEGSTRSGTDPNGKRWENTLKSHYGYIKGTVGKDKSHIDVFIKLGTAQDYAGPVFVIDQKKPGNGHFDEHKVMLGWDNKTS